MAWPGWENLVKGDIMARNGHTEIFSHNEGGRHYVWNVGSPTSANNPGTTPSAKDSYSVIYRCNSGKGSGITADNIIRSTRNKASMKGIMAAKGSAMNPLRAARNLTNNLRARGSNGTFTSAYNGINGKIRSSSSTMNDTALNKISMAYNNKPNEGGFENE